MNTLAESLRLERATDRRRAVRVPRGLKRRRIGRLDGYTVWVVDGERVRNELHVDFTCGGNWAVYPYVNAKEIWIDDALGALDATATLLHEYIECERMKKLGETYEQAHDVASAREARFREELAERRPRKIDIRRVEEALLEA